MIHFFVIIDCDIILFYYSNQLINVIKIYLACQ